MMRLFVCPCCCFAWADPSGRIINPDQIFSDHANDAITIYAQLLLRSWSGAAKAPHDFNWLIVFSWSQRSTMKPCLSQVLLYTFSAFRESLSPRRRFGPAPRPWGLNDGEVEGTDHRRRRLTCSRVFRTIGLSLVPFAEPEPRFSSYVPFRISSTIRVAGAVMFPRWDFLLRRLRS